MDHPQLEDRGFLPKDLLHILVGGAGGDDAQLGVPHLNPVQIAGLGVLGQAAHPVLHHRVAADGIARHHYILGDVLLIGTLRPLGPGAGLHDGLGVGHPGAHLQDHRSVELLGDLIGPPGEGQGLGGVGGFQHGQLGGDGVVPGVLLVLGGVHPRVVGHRDDHARIDTGIGHSEQRVSGHVESHVLHGAEGPLSCQAGAESHLHGYLLIGGPLTVNIVEFGGLLGDLGAGGAGVAGDHAAARLVKSPGNGGVAQHQLFHESVPCFLYCSSPQSRTASRTVTAQDLLWALPGPPG